jgi:hypothetical protein
VPEAVTEAVVPLAPETGEVVGAPPVSLQKFEDELQLIVTLKEPPAYLYTVCCVG